MDCFLNEKESLALPLNNWLTDPLPHSNQTSVITATPMSVYSIKSIVQIRHNLFMLLQNYFSAHVFIQPFFIFSLYSNSHSELMRCCTLLLDPWPDLTIIAFSQEKFQGYLSREGERLRQQDRATMGKN